MRLDYFQKSALILAILALGACGGKTKSQEVNVSILPSNPIVFSSPYSYTNSAGTLVSIAGPWTRFQVSIDVPQSVNESVTIVHVNAQATGVDASGNSAFAQADFDPTTDNFTTQSGVVCNYSDYGQFDPGGSMVLPTTFISTASYNGIPLFEMPVSSSLGCNAVALPTFYFGGLPAPIINQPGVVSTYNFNLLITPEGWFGTRTAPTDRFTNSVQAITQ